VGPAIASTSTGRKLQRADHRKPASVEAGPSPSGSRHRWLRAVLQGLDEFTIYNRNLTASEITQTSIRRRRRQVQNTCGNGILEPGAATTATPPAIAACNDGFPGTYNDTQRPGGGPPSSARRSVTRAATAARLRDALTGAACNDGDACFLTHVQRQRGPGLDPVAPPTSNTRACNGTASCTSPLAGNTCDGNVQLGDTCDGRHLHGQLRDVPGQCSSSGPERHGDCTVTPLSGPAAATATRARRPTRVRAAAARARR
jgi:hypothetical protein